MPCRTGVSSVITAARCTSEYAQQQSRLNDISGLRLPPAKNRRDREWRYSGVIGMPTPFNDQAQPVNDQAQLEQIKQLLFRAPVIQNACDLDLMVFLHRHPRTLLTSEQVSALVGYNLREVAKSIDAFIEVGLLERTAQQSMHAARMFVLLLDSPQGAGIRALLELSSTRKGRQRILEALNTRGSPPEATPELRLVKYV